jgi:MFS family permease
MKKDNARLGLVALITLAVYHLIVFLVPFEHNSVFWISYGFTLGGFAVAVTSAYLAFLKNPDAKSRFYGFPIARIGVIYGIGQVIASLLIMVLSTHIPSWLAVILYAAGMGAALLGLIGAEAMMSETQTMDAKLKKDISLMRGLQSKVSQLAAHSGDPAVRALAEEFRYSDPVSNENLMEAESELAYSVDMLQNAVMDGDKESTAHLCARTAALLSERNRQCKLNK